MSNDGQVCQEQIERLIPRFYTRVCDDALIGPVFNGAIADWQHHLEKLVTFWSLQGKAARLAESLKLAMYFRLSPASGLSPRPAPTLS